LYSFHGAGPGTVSCWKQEFLNKGPELFGKDTTLAQYEKRISELERLLALKYDIQADPTTKLTIPGIDLDQYAHMIG